MSNDKFLYEDDLVDEGIGYELLIEDGDYGNHPSKNGLFPKDAVVLFLVPKYKVSETNYPRYFEYSYGISDLYERIAFLKDKGMLRPGTKAEDIGKLTVTKLKEIAKKHGLKTTGKKEDILGRITGTLSEIQIESENIDVYWKLTVLGEKEKAETRYLEYYFEHSLDFSDLKTNINDLNEAQYNNPNINFDGYILQRINEREKECLFELETKKASDYYDYCETMKVRSHYLRNHRKYEEAIYWYAKYLYYMCNVRQCIQYRKWKEYHDIDRDDLFMIGEYLAADLSLYQDEAQMDYYAFYTIVKKAFCDVDVMGQTDCATFFELFKYDYEGDKDGLISFLKNHF